MKLNRRKKLVGKAVNNLKNIIITLSAFVAVFAFAGYAQAAGPDKTEGFVCPVLNNIAGEHNPNTIQISGGDYSLIPSGEPRTINVPVQATNSDGAGSPGGEHSSPGEKGYTPIWATD